jgi:hypothetical protein
VKKPAELCPHCDAKMVEYCHSLSKSLARVIYRITQNLDRERRFHVGSIGLTNSQINNTQKLRYWDIIAKEPDASAKGGHWKLTDAGLAFAQGRIPMRKKVWTYRGDVVRFEGGEVWIMDVAGGWKYRPDYAREGRPHDPDPNQSRLFS